MRPLIADRSRPVAVLFDRDGTLVSDVPYNGDPERVVPIPDAQACLMRLRQAGLRLGMVTNQSALGRGLISPAVAETVQRRVLALLGPFDTVRVCPHTPAQRCRCRKPAPGLILDAANDLALHPHDCLVVGDSGSDIEAAWAAGADALLVPTPATSPVDIAAAPRVAPHLDAVVEWLLRLPLHPARHAAEVPTRVDARRSPAPGATP